MEFIADNHQYKNILDPLLANTVYFTQQQVLDGIEKLITHWKSMRPNIPLYVNQAYDKSGSEHWLYGTFRDILPPHKVIFRGTKDLPDACEILFLDDWCITGANMAGTMEEILYKNPNTVNTKFTATVLVFCRTDFCHHSLDEILPYYPNLQVSISHEVIVPTFVPNVDVEIGEQFLRTFVPDTRAWASAVHLEYKANHFGSYGEIYRKCRSTPVETPYTSRKFKESERQADGCWPCSVATNVGVHPPTPLIKNDI
jgi:hypothetical protein